MICWKGLFIPTHSHTPRPPLSSLDQLNDVLNAPDSEEDAPQQLLPLPDALPVDPDLDDLKVALTA